MSPSVTVRSRGASATIPAQRTRRGRAGWATEPDVVPAQRRSSRAATQPKRGASTATGAQEAGTPTAGTHRAGTQRISGTQKAYARREERLRRAAGGPQAKGAAAGRAQFVLLVMVLLGIGLVATLWLSTAAAADSYRLQDARAAARILSSQSERLHREVASMESAPELARRAAGIGMVPVRDPARLVVQPDGSVTVVGVPAPAAAKAPPVPAAPRPAPVDAAAPADATSQTPADQAAPEPAAGVPAGQPGEGADPATTGPDGAAPGPIESAGTGGAAGPSAAGPSGTGPSGAGPSGADPAATGPAATGPAATAADRTDPAAAGTRRTGEAGGRPDIGPAPTSAETTGRGQEGTGEDGNGAGGAGSGRAPAQPGGTDAGTGTGTGSRSGATSASGRPAPGAG